MRAESTRRQGFWAGSVCCINYLMPSMSPATSSAPPLSSEELAAWRGMLQIHARVTRALDVQMRGEHGLSVSEYEVLMFLGDAEGNRMRMSEIADRVLLSRSGLTRMVDRLTKLGYVERCAAEDDGRGLFAELTQAGRETLHAARPTHLRAVRMFFLDRLSLTDRMVLGDIWTRLLEAR